jgi:hypothetical protein
MEDETPKADTAWVESMSFAGQSAVNRLSSCTSAAPCFRFTKECGMTWSSPRIALKSVISRLCVTYNGPVKSKCTSKRVDDAYLNDWVLWDMLRKSSTLVRRANIVVKTIGGFHWGWKHSTLFLDREKLHLTVLEIKITIAAFSVSVINQQMQIRKLVPPRRRRLEQDCWFYLMEFVVASTRGNVPTPG